MKFRINTRRSLRRPFVKDVAPFFGWILVSVHTTITPVQRTGSVAEIILHRDCDARNPMVFQLRKGRINIAVNISLVQVVRRVHVSAPWNLEANVLLVLAEILNVLPIDWDAEIIDGVDIDTVAGPKAEILACREETLNEPYAPRTSFRQQMNGSRDRFTIRAVRKIGREWKILRISREVEF